jgi:aromatic-amino-acid transaminase
LDNARPGDVVLLQGASHNPSGVELDPAEATAVIATIVSRGLIPFVDLAYQGLGRGLEEDASFARRLFEACDEAILAYSCSKNFGLYRERTGALWVRSATPSAGRIVRQNLLRHSRSLWSMPPDHGASLVRMVLESSDLSELWRQELNLMRARLTELRRDLVAVMPWLPPGTGLFTMLGIEPQHVTALRDTHGIYVAPDGRINLAGLGSNSDIAALAFALRRIKGL